jgi:hypothetical protein
MRALAVAASLAALPAAPAQALPDYDQWQPTGSMAAGRAFQQSAVLADGDVLVAGGVSDLASGAAISSSEIYSARTGTWSAAADMPSPVAGGTAVTLRDGRVLLVGGQNMLGGAGGSNTALLFDPRTNSWSSTANTMSANRGSGTPAVLLPTGKVLLPSAEDLSGTTDLFDPATNKFQAVAPMLDPVLDPCAALLPGGEVLVAGGIDTRLGPRAAAELYDPATNTWSFARNSMSSPREGCAAAALPSGKVLVAGGYPKRILGPDDLVPTASTDLFDPRTDSFTPGPPMNYPGGGFAMVPLPDGRVLAGGGSIFDPKASTEVYFANANRWVPAGDLPGVNVIGSMNALPDGRVLVEGGIDSSGGPSSPTGTTAAALFTPAATPSPPRSIAATPTAHGVLVSFAPPVDDGGLPVEHYTVRASTGQTASTPDARTSLTISGLKTGVPVSFTVTATNPVGVGAPSGSSASVIPGAPQLRIIGLKRRLSSRAFRNGLRFRIKPNKAAVLEVSLLASVSRASIARVHNVTLASSRFALSAATRSVRLRPPATVTGRPSRGSVEVVITATDASGNSATTIEQIAVGR